MTIEPGSVWRVRPGWEPEDSTVIVEDVKGRRIHFADWTGTRHPGPYILDIDLFLETYEPLPDRDTETPSMFGGGE